MQRLVVLESSVAAMERTLERDLEFLGEMAYVAESEDDPETKRHTLATFLRKEKGGFEYSAAYYFVSEYMDPLPCDNDICKELRIIGRMRPLVEAMGTHVEIGVSFIFWEMVAGEFMATRGITTVGSVESRGAVSRLENATGAVDDLAAGIRSLARPLPPTVTRGTTRLLPQLSQSTVDDVLASSARLKGRTPEGARAIAKKLGRAEREGFRSAFDGIQPTQANAEKIIRETLDNPNSAFVGDKVIDVFNAAGQGVRIDRATSTFVGFLEQGLVRP